MCLIIGISIHINDSEKNNTTLALGVVREKDSVGQKLKDKGTFISVSTWEMRKKKNYRTHKTYY